jgi:peptidoglycan/LPS O-acetylase OafA/YrhL
VEVLGIDLARFVAATMVVMWHFAAKPWLDPQAATISPLMPGATAAIPPGAWVSAIGWVGVQIFFVISGAVIAFSAGRASNRRAFVISRFARLWPAMVVCGAVCSVLSMVFWHTGVMRALAGFAGSLVLSPVGPWFSGQVWTLPVEVAFYALVCVVGVGRRARLEGLAWALALASGAYWMTQTLWPGVLSGVNPHLLAIMLLPHGCYFALGIALARGHAEGSVRWALMAVSIGTAWLEISARYGVELGRTPCHPGALVPYLAWLGAVLFIIGSFAWAAPIHAAFARQSRILRLMGAVTYPLYLAHYQVGGPVYAALITRGWSVWGAFVPAYALAVAVALILARYVEAPMQRVVKTVLNRRRLGPEGQGIPARFV